MADILIVDDDQAIATAFEHFLTYEGHTFRLASSAAEGMTLLEQRSPDVVVMDVRMPGVDGVTALQQMRRRFPNLYVVMMTAYSSSQSSIDAIRAGAFDYLTKPLDLDELRDVIGRALAARQASGESAAAAAADLQPPVTLIGGTPAMLEVYKLIGRLATNSVTALIVGEHGTGKGLVVATIHGNSARRDRPLVRLACASVSGAELDTALFGPGAGTVELAAIHLLPSPLQSKLAHALAAERTPVGGSRLTARLIVTTDRDLAEETAAGNFSRELYDEIAVIVLRLPPLRERREDIPLLVQHFIQRFHVELNRSIRGVDEQVARLMQAHAWPGNLAELERVIKRAAIVTRSDVITLHDIGESLADNRFPGRPDVESALERAVRASLQERLVQTDGTASSVFHDIVDAVESTLVREALAITNGNQVKAADILGVNRATLRKKMPDA